MASLAFDDLKKRRAAWYTLGVLMLLMIVSIIDRSVISMLIGDIQRTLGINDFQASLIMGPAFGISYVLCSIPFGWAIDRYPRPLVTCLGILCWSIACMLGGFATTFAALILSRMLVGAGEASLSPATYSLVADLFPRNRISRAIALFHLAGSLGGGLSLTFGGLIAQLAVDLHGKISLPTLGVMHVWQFGLICAGLPGLFLAFLALSFPEPRRNAPAARPQTTPDGLREFVIRNRRLLLCQSFAFSLGLAIVYGTGFWLPQYFLRTFGWAPAKTGMILAISIFSGAMIGQFIAVRAIERLTESGYKDATLRAYLFMAMASLAGSLITFLAPTGPVAVFGLLIIGGTLHPLMTYGSSALQLYVPPAYRGRISGTYLSFVNMIGMAGGPSMVGFVTHYVLMDEKRIGLSLALVSGTALTLVIILIVFSLRPLRRAIQEAEQSSSSAAALA